MFFCHLFDNHGSITAVSLFYQSGPKKCNMLFFDIEMSDCMLYFQFGYAHTITIMLHLYYTSFLLFASDWFSISVQPGNGGVVGGGRTWSHLTQMCASKSKGLLLIKVITFWYSLWVRISTDITCYNINLQ